MRPKAERPESRGRQTGGPKHGARARRTGDPGKGWTGSSTVEHAEPSEPFGRFPFAGPPWLFAVVLIGIVVTLVLAYWGVPTALFSGYTAWCLAWLVLPPERGVVRHLPTLGVGLALTCLGTWYWAWLWS